jgi:carboxymethylenebutenolidase
MLSIKKLLLSLTVCMVASTTIFAQNGKSCCAINATDAFARLGDDKEFMASHASPLPYQYEGKAGQMITFTTPDGKKANAFEFKAAKKSNKYLFVFQEWWGLNDYIKRESEKYFNELGDVNVIALDLYDGKVTTDPKQAGEYMQGADQKRLDAIVKGALSYVGKNAKIATVGWCFGGGQSLNAALLTGKQAVGCVMYYGMPEKDVNRLKTLNCDVLGLFAAKEKWITPEVVTQFEKDMQTAGKKVQVKMFEAEHAFANPSNPSYDKEATAEAYKLSSSYLKARLK